VRPSSHANASPGESPPPEGAPWDAPIDVAPLAFLDLEMTGLRVGEDRVIEVCVERMVGSTVAARIERVVRPGELRGGQEIHGIGDDELADAEPFSSIADELLAAIDGAVVVAHGAAWDLAFLADELGRIGLAARAPTHALDTLVLARRAFYLPRYNLASLAQSLGVLVTRAHRAGDDVATLRGVFSHIRASLDPTTPRDLWNVRIGEHAPRAEIIAQVERAIATAGPVELMYRPTHRAPETLSMVLTELSPPLAIGYLLPGRGRRELRIDRILRIEERSSPRT
jgi:DNA polymerase-3 subunit epsilon